jgi:1-acyl-sn-glycerol-3-phosphate acyltransferase
MYLCVTNALGAHLLAPWDLLHTPVARHVARMMSVFPWIVVMVACCVPFVHDFAGTLCQAIWPFFNIYSLAASSVFSIPFWRHFIAWLGSVEATPKNFKRILKKGSVAVIVGGIAEMYMQVRGL